MSVREAVRPARLLIAAKTALAVAIAWMIAPLMPGVTDEYPYYAPLGALISMYPTLMASFRSSMQTMLGLAAGLGLAGLVLLLSAPNVWMVAAVVAVGTLLSGTGWFGVGREYIPMAALFVLIIGGPDADAYSLGYLTQMAVGVTVGLAINLFIPPAPFGAETAARIDAFQHTLAAHLHAIGDAVTDSWPPENDQWTRDAASLAETARDLRQALSEADDSLRANPRAWLRHTDTRAEHRRLQMLDDAAHQIGDISGVLADTIWERPGSLGLDTRLTEPLAAACHAVADALLAPREGEDAEKARAAAGERVDQLLQAVDDSSLDAGSAIGPGVLTAMHLRRLLLLTEPEDDD